MSNEQKGQVDRKGKGRAKDQNQNADREDEERQHQGAGDQRNEEGQQQMKEVRRPPPLPAVKGTIGAIESPSRRSFFSGSPTTVRGNHSRAPSHDVTYRQPEFPSPYPQQQQQQQQQDDFRTRDRPVFRSDPTLTTTFDRLRLSKKEELRSLFGA